MVVVNKLDTVLGTLNNVYKLDRVNENVFSIKRITIEQVINFTIGDFKVELSKMDMELVLEKLIDDKHVKRVEQSNPQVLLYYITYVGSVFVETGGYGLQNQNDQRQNRIAVRNEILLIVGSLGAMIAGLSVVVIELLKHYVWITKP